MNERLKEDMVVIFPSDDIICRRCANKDTGILGYKKYFCETYKDGKPLGILFENEMCEHFEEEK